MAIAAAFGIPGIILARLLARDESSKFQQSAKKGAAVGSYFLLAGIMIWATAMLSEFVDSKNRPGPCISWRDPNVQSASEDKLPDCVPKSRR